jgi:dTMP kinase
MRPDLTLIFDLPVAEGLRRALSRNGGEERFEAKGAAFHERLRAAYLDIARAEPERCVVIDATATLDAVEAAILAAVQPRLGT